MRIPREFGKLRRLFNRQEEFKIILVFIIKNLYIILFRYVEARFIYNRRYLFGHRLMTAYMQAPYPFFLQRNTNELLRNINEEVNLLINKVLAPLMKITKESVMALAVVIFLLTVEPLITLFVLFAMGLTAGLFLLSPSAGLKALGKRPNDAENTCYKLPARGSAGSRMPVSPTGRGTLLKSSEKWSCD